jgi:hypothetical protein
MTDPDVFAWAAIAVIVCWSSLLDSRAEKLVVQSNPTGSLDARIRIWRAVIEAIEMMSNGELILVNLLILGFVYFGLELFIHAREVFWYWQNRGEVKQ